MKTEHGLLLILLMASISACGGGGEGNTSSPASVPLEPSPTPSPPVQSDDKSGAQSLLIDADFTLNSEIELLLDIKPNSLQSGSYLSICKYTPETLTINRQECVFKGPIASMGIKESIMLAHRETALAAEIWLFAENYRPEPYFWQYDAGAVEQVFSVH